ncbi:MAG: hypothetical protein NUV77_07985 [Thermoguttaceae bacterium]|nr:hypothetical protein [Thermoguttaceae bacterium]
MPLVSRRQFAAGALASPAAVASSLWASDDRGAPPLPTVRLGKHEISRLLVGHNPIKGVSHQSRALDLEMREYFAADRSRGVALLEHCQSLGINACQIGFRPTEAAIEQMLRTFFARGGQMRWFATLYSPPQDINAVEKEIARRVHADPPPLGIQQLGNTSDWLMKQGKLDLALENLKRIRDAGVLVGLGSHNHEVIDYAETKGWDVDFYQCCFYRSVFSLDPAKAGKETYEEEARASMTRTIRQVSKPCIAFKVLAAGRHCGSRATIEAALRYAYEYIKPTDVVLVGMWQKHKDQVAENVALARKILAHEPSLPAEARAGDGTDKKPATGLRRESP